jgi:hypothetical protein
MNVDVQVASTDALRAGVWRLRYDLFLRERHWTPPEADHVGRRLKDTLDSHSIVLAAVDPQTHAVVGTIRTTLLSDGSVPVYPALYRLTDLSAATWATCSITSYLGVALPHRRTGIGARLARTLFDLRVARGVKFDYLDCPTDLVPYFLRCGYRWLRAIRHPWAGPSHLMQLSLLDTDHLIAVHSPLIAARPPQPPPA